MKNTFFIVYVSHHVHYMEKIFHRQLKKQIVQNYRRDFPEQRSEDRFKILSFIFELLAWQDSTKSSKKHKGGPLWSKIWQKNFFLKNDPITPNFMRGIDCAHSQTLKTLPWPWFRETLAKNAIFDFFPESGSGKRFQGLGMRAIDSPHKIRGNRVIF